MHWLHEIGGPAIITLIGTAIVAAGAVWSTIEQNRSALKIADKNEEIARLSTRIASSVTGGTAICHIIWSPAASYVLSTSQFPMYDVDAVITDYTDRKINARKDDRRMNIGNVPPYAAIGPYPNLLQPSEDKGHWLVGFSARNGHFWQELIAKKVEGQWETATRVAWTMNTTDASGIAFEAFSPNYPKSSGSSDFTYIRDDWGAKQHTSVKAEH